MTVRRGIKEGDQTFESAEDGTVYWTLSLYIEADKVAETLGLSPDRWVEPRYFRAIQRGHLPSLALANAIDPLMNDIADRETNGQVQEVLLAAIDDDGEFTDLKAAAAEVRKHKTLTFKMPKSVSWTTEGVTFHAHPEDLDHDREVRLRRFWLSHNNGALSYHLSFSHFYGRYFVENGGPVEAGGPAQSVSGYDPSTFYFLSMMQKLAAPKEYALDPTVLKTLADDASVDVFQTLGIDPLDNIKVSEQGDEGQRFWPFVRAMLNRDAQTLFAKLPRQPGATLPLRDDYADQLLERAPFIEVPGLSAPKARIMFMFQDERFFNRLMPVDAVTNETLPRKRMVQAGCYEPYEAAIQALMKPKAEPRPATVHLGPAPGGPRSGEREDPGYWSWVRERGGYREDLERGALVLRNPKVAEEDLDSVDDNHWRAIDPKRPSTEAGGVDSSGLTPLEAAVRSGECYRRFEHDERYPDCKRFLSPPVKVHIPAFSENRADCLEYMFLAGFNQNIIDFMNQDTSEILDSIDPIYPESDAQSDERFFVRYANHRAMITYVPKSRSLEIGNDYIGACPYAFLIHALALHNEYLARGHEAKTLARIKRIKHLIDAKPFPDDDDIQELQRRERLVKGDRYEKAEAAINHAKLARFERYEKYRHDNPFRYDTERDVFAKLEQLRGINRKEGALSSAIDSLDEYAGDIQSRNQQAAGSRENARALMLSLLLGFTGVFGAGQMFYWIGEKSVDAADAEAAAARKAVEGAGDVRHSAWPLDQMSGDDILSWTERMMFWVLFALIAVTVIWLVVAIFSRRKTTEPNYDAPEDRKHPLRKRSKGPVRSR
jgi:hypothetical protein